MSKKQKEATKKKGGFHLQIRQNKWQRKRMKHVAAYQRRWRKLHPELKPDNSG